MEKRKYDTYEISGTQEASLGRFTILLDTVEKDGGQFPFSFLQVKNSISILPIVGSKILLVRQYRHALSSWQYEIPGGAYEEGEDLFQAASRELLEETGYQIDELLELGTFYPSPGLMDERAYLCAAICHDAKSAAREALELMEAELFSEERFVEMIRDNTFSHGMGLVAWLKYQMVRNSRN